MRKRVVLPTQITMLSATSSLQQGEEAGSNEMTQ